MKVEGVVMSTPWASLRRGIHRGRTRGYALAMRELPVYAVNLRRLFAWHLQSNKDVARLLGAAEHSVSGWLTGKRSPGMDYLEKIGELYGVDPFAIRRDSDAFGAHVADPERSHAAEARIAEAREMTA
jgi:transcriptional regulator with XRE-family HTH domain